MIYLRPEGAPHRIGLNITFKDWSIGLSWFWITPPFAATLWRIRLWLNRLPRTSVGEWSTLDDYLFMTDQHLITQEVLEDYLPTGFDSQAERGKTQYGPILTPKDLHFKGNINGPET